MDVTHLDATQLDPARMDPMPTQLLTGLPDARQAEVFTTLLTQPGVRLERIVSQGQASPPDFWYEQPHGEWVLLLAGAAELELAEGTLRLTPGDCLYLAPYQRHRVHWTCAEPPTVWLALHLGEVAHGSEPAA